MYSEGSLTKVVWYSDFKGTPLSFAMTGHKIRVMSLSLNKCYVPLILKQHAPRFMLHNMYIITYILIVFTFLQNLSTFFSSLIFIEHFGLYGDMLLQITQTRHLSLVLKKVI
jgi:hypothetical protein